MKKRTMTTGDGEPTSQTREIEMRQSDARNTNIFVFVIAGNRFGEYILAHQYSIRLECARQPATERSVSVRDFVMQCVASNAWVYQVRAHATEALHLPRPRCRPMPFSEFPSGVPGRCLGLCAPHITRLASPEQCSI